MRTSKKMMTFFVIISICYMYIATVASYFGINIDRFGISEHRAQLLIVVLFVGLLNILSLSKLKFVINETIFSGFLLILYMFFLGINNNIGFFSWISCSVMWLFFIFVIYNMFITEKDLNFIVFATILTAIILSIIQIYGLVTPGLNLDVAGTNSIYYILGIVPFVFLTPNIWIRFLGLGFISCAIIISGKSTCLIALFFIWLLFIVKFLSKQNITKSKLITRLVLVIVFMFAVFKIVSIYIMDGDTASIFTNTWEELISGGNGRADIYSATLEAFVSSPIIKQIFGHGFDSINLVIGIGTHNDFLMVLYNYGLIGFILYLYFWFSLIKGIIYLKKANSKFLLAYEVSIIVYFFISMASNVLNTQVQFLLLCMFWGLCSQGKPIEYKY